MKNKKVIKMIESYQQGISSSTAPRCRFTPSCSNYAKECYQKFGFVKASLLTTKRIAKCNPLFKGGYDPVPLSKVEKLELEKSENNIEKITKNEE